MQRDNYDKEILKQLTRIASSLEKLEKKVPDASRVTFERNAYGKLIVGCKFAEKTNS